MLQHRVLLGRRLIRVWAVFRGLWPFGRFPVKDLPECLGAVLGFLAGVTGVIVWYRRRVRLTLPVATSDAVDERPPPHSGRSAVSTPLRCANSRVEPSILVAITIARAGSPVSLLSISILSAARLTSSPLTVNTIPAISPIFSSAITRVTGETWRTCSSP